MLLRICKIFIEIFESYGALFFFFNVFDSVDYYLKEESFVFVPFNHI